MLISWMNVRIEGSRMLKMERRRWVSMRGRIRTWHHVRIIWRRLKHGRRWISLGRCSRASLRTQPGRGVHLKDSVDRAWLTHSQVRVEVLPGHKLFDIIESEGGVSEFEQSLALCKLVLNMLGMSARSESLTMAILLVADSTCSRTCCTSGMFRVALE